MTTPRQQALRDYARFILHRDGYARFGYTAVATHFDITRSAVQQALGKKDDLVADLLAEARTALEQVTGAYDAVPDADPRMLLDTFFDYARAEVDAGLALCIMGVVVSNYEALPDRLRTMTDAFTALLSDQLATVLETGRTRGVYAFDGDACEKAEFVMSAMRGARLLARQRGPAALEGTIACLRQALGETPR